MSADQGITAPPDFSALSAEHEAEQTAGPATATPTPESPAATAAATTATPAADSTAATPAAATTDAASSTDSSDEGKAAGVATPDGKHIIPAAELTNSRRKNAELRDTVDKLTGQVDVLTKQIRDNTAAQSAGTSAAATTAATDIAAQVAAAGDDVAEQREALAAGVVAIRAETPWLADEVERLLAPVITKLGQSMGELGAVKKELAVLKTEREQFQQREQAAQATVLETAIANTPVVAHWQEHGGEAWERAQLEDNVLRTHPKWANKPLTERFAEVQRRVVSVLGPEVVPESLRTKPEAAPGLDKDKVVAAAQAKLNQAGPAIASLSDIPGGTPAAASLASELADDQVSNSRLEEHYRGKSPADIMAAFRT